MPEINYVEQEPLRLDSDSTTITYEPGQTTTDVTTDTIGPSSIVSFYSEVSYPIIDSLFTIEPVQDLHGYDAPWPAGGGKNLIKPDLYQASENIVDIGQNDNTSFGTYLEAGTYTIHMTKNTEKTVSIYRREENDSTNTWSGTVPQQTFTISTTGNYRFWLYNDTGISVSDFSDVQIEKGSTATSYAPYSNICPISGFESAKVQRCGKNLFNVSDVEFNGYYDINGSKHLESALSSYIIGCKESTTYTATGYFGAIVTYWDTNKDFILGESLGSSNIKTFTTPERCEYFRISISNSLIANNDQIELGSVSTIYEPYQGSFYDVSWQSEAGTVYGGTLDVTTGVLTVNRVLFEKNSALMDNSNDYPGWKNSGIRALGYTGTGIFITIGNVGTKLSYNFNGANDVVFLSKALYNNLTQTDWIALAQDVQFVIPLVTPLTYQLTPVQISTVLGYNNIWSNTGDSTIEYATTVTTVTSDFSISITGGSGTGKYHWKLYPSTGLATLANGKMEVIDNSATQNFRFVESGSSIVSVYKESSKISENTYYIQSKTLVFELQLDEKQVKIVVEPTDTVVYPFGHDYNINDFSIAHPNTTNTEYNNVLSTKPELYLPYNVRDTKDFYRFDVLSKSVGSGYSSGVQYISNEDGSWTIKGTPTSGTSYYNLIVSDTKMPDYLFSYSKYMYCTTAVSEPVTTEMVLYFKDETTVTDLSANTYLVLPENICGFLLRFKVTGTIDSTIEVHWYSLKDRIVDNTSDESYYVSASGGVVSGNHDVYKKYNEELSYKSSKMRFLNNQEYSIINLSNQSHCIVTGLKSNYLPKTDIVFTVTAKPNYYYEDGWEEGNIYTSIEAYNLGTWGSWWSDEDVGICTGTGDLYSDQFFFRIRSIDTYVTPSSYEDVPFHRLSSKYDEKGRLIEGTYWIKMPPNNTEIVIKFTEIIPDIGVYTWPYRDIIYSDSATGSESRIVLRDEQYADAMLFCYYARQQYFPDDISSGRLLGSPYNVEDPGSPYYGKFFRTIYHLRVYDDSEFFKYICLGDAVKSLRMISHNISYDEDSWVLFDDSVPNSITKDPDGYLKNKSSYSNYPNAVSSGFAGYPPDIRAYKISTSYNIHYPYDYSRDKITYTDCNNKVAVKYMDYWYSAPVDFDYNTAITTANSDFVSWARDIPIYSWGAWIGAVLSPYQGVSPNFNPGRSITFSEACKMLWRYAKFRQFNILDTLPYEAPPGLSKWFLQQPECLWALSRGIVTGFRAPFDQGSIDYMPNNRPISPESVVNRFEWAFMLSQFCKQYAWALK